MDTPAAPAAVAPAEPNTEPANDAGFGDFGDDEMSGKPDFDKEPFDAGVQADEETDPKKFIEQLTGKLGQSLRKYNQELGQPDFELEKFAINSLLSATHTGEMDENDRKDIIKKVNTSGNDDTESSDFDNQDNTDFGDDIDSGADDGSGDDVSLDFSPDEEDLGESSFEIYESENLFLDEPKRNNMFQPGSNDALTETKPCWSGYEQIGMKEMGGKEVPNCVPIKENKNDNLINVEKNRIFDKKTLLSKLQESLNQDNMNLEPETKPVVKPAETKPLTQPSRRQKTFLPEPATQPDPKAKN